MSQRRKHREGDDAATLARRGTTVRDAECERALRRLEAAGDLTPGQRRAVERLADRLVVRLLARPAYNAADVDDEAAVEMLTEIFAGGE
jgi:glutamyl-tRNA reductase